MIQKTDILPSDFTAFDLELDARIKRLLASSHYPQIRDVRVRLEESQVHLDGVVPSYYLKQLTQKLVMSTVGVTSIQNNVQVVAPLRE